MYNFISRFLYNSIKMWYGKMYKKKYHIHIKIFTIFDIKVKLKIRTLPLVVVRLWERLLLWNVERLWDYRHNEPEKPPVFFVLL